MNTTDVVTEKAEIEKAKEAELQEIWLLLLQIRRSTGYGKILLELRGGKIVEIETTIKRRPEAEKKNIQ